MIKTVLFIIFFCITGVGPSNGQEPSAISPPAATPESETEPESLSVSQISTRADETNAELLTLFDMLQEPGPEIEVIPAEIEALAKKLEEVLEPVNRSEISAMGQPAAETLLQTLNRIDRELRSQHKNLEQRAEFLDQQRQVVKNEIDYLQGILESAGSEDLPVSLVERLETLSGQMQAARVAVGDRLDLALDELSEISTIDLRIRDYTQLLEMRLSAQNREVFALEEVPIWQLGELDSDFRGQLTRELRSRIEAADEYIKTNAAESIAMVLFLVFLIVISLVSFRSIRYLAESGAVEDRAREFLLRPVATVMLLWVTLGPELILPPLPMALVTVRILICAFALWRLIPRVKLASEQSALRALIILSALAVILKIWTFETVYGRVTLIIIDVLGIYWFRRLGQSLRETTDTTGLWLHISRFIAALAPYLLGVGILGTLIGAVALADQVSQGLFVILIAILSLMVIESVLNTLAEVFLMGSGKNWFRFMRHYPDLTRSRISILIRIGMLILFLIFIPRAFPFLDTVTNATITVLTRPVEFGTVSLSLATVLGLIISLAIAIGVARFVRFILDEDVFPRLPVAPGAASAASRLIYYALVLAGIVFALAASGVELSSLTLVISALGVGIGFGLQGIVNNFVSGLVLAFERPFKTGDMIAVGQLFGRVRQIGLRASRIRTFDGAEVIVPNADLISGELINWTLSDQNRRGDIEVGIAYGADTTRVREALLKVAADNEQVAKHPEPVTLMLGFDDSSIKFALRVWISNASDWPEIADELYDAVHVALAEASIEIPFPQRTIHLRTNDDTD